MDAKPHAEGSSSKNTPLSCIILYWPPVTTTLSAHVCPLHWSLTLFPCLPVPSTMQRLWCHPQMSALQDSCCPGHTHRRTCMHACTRYTKRLAVIHVAKPPRADSAAVNLTHAGVTGEREPQLRSHPCQTALWAKAWAVFLTND